jgi:hypothetical protein
MRHPAGSCSPLHAQVPRGWRRRRSRQFWGLRIRWLVRL